MKVTYFIQILGICFFFEGCATTPAQLNPQPDLTDHSLGSKQKDPQKTKKKPLFRKAWRETQIYRE